MLPRDVTKNVWTPPIVDPNEVTRIRGVVDEIASDVEARCRALSSKDPSLSSGAAGLALFFHHHGLAFRSERSLRIAEELMEIAANALATTTMSAGLYSGLTGIAWSYAHLSSDGDSDALAEIDDALLQHVRRTPWEGHYDLISGLVGIAVYALERMPSPAGRGLLGEVVCRLDELATEDDAGTRWWTPPHHVPPAQRERHPDGHVNLGVAHGMPAVLPVLAAATANEVEAGRAARLLGGSIRWLTALPPASTDSVFAYAHHPDVPDVAARSAWCYGDPGVAAALVAAGAAAGDERLLRHALDVGRRSSTRLSEAARILDAQLCHGSAGVAHLFARLYQHGGEETFRRAAVRFFDDALDRRGEGGVAGFANLDRGDPRPVAGFLGGAAGVGLALISAVTPHVPDWDRLLVASLRGAGDG